MTFRLSNLVVGILLVGAGLAIAEEQPAWRAGKVYEGTGVRVELSQPVLVARSPGFLWFPTLVPLADGRLLAIMSNYADQHVKVATSSNAFSTDGGLTWSKPLPARYGETNIRLANGDELLLPYYLNPVEGGMTAPYVIVPRGKEELKLVEPGVKVTGWPRPDKRIEPLGLAGFVFNGDTLTLADGTYLATLYGTFKDAKRYSLMLAESKDGIDWKIRTTIADENCPVQGGEGPCESAICRLKDGRLMSIFRLASNVPYGQAFSTDDGKSWTTAEPLPGVFSVQPSLVARKDGSLALSGGRPGSFLWLNLDGAAKDWQKFDVLANHNEFKPDEPIKSPANTSSYTEIIPLDDTHLLYIYDRVPFSWNAIPKDSKETNSVWVVRVTLERK